MAINLQFYWSIIIQEELTGKAGDQIWKPLQEWLPKEIPKRTPIIMTLPQAIHFFKCITLLFSYFSYFGYHLAYILLDRFGSDIGNMGFTIATKPVASV